MSPQLPELFANETLYQLSYTPNLRSQVSYMTISGIVKDACLYRHEIIGNYYG